MPNEDPSHNPAGSSSEPADSESDSPPWMGHWKVIHWDDQSPSHPTYYMTTLQSWDVVKMCADGPHVAPHPILEIDDDVIVLKDEGADDADRERWRAEVTGDRLTVTALTGPHEGAVGVAERTETDPYQFDPEAANQRSG